MIALCGVCAVLVTAAANLGAARPEDEFTAATQPSNLTADYSVDETVPRYAPVSQEIVQATSRDNVALGLVKPGASLATSHSAVSAGVPDLSTAEDAVAPSVASSALPSGQPLSVPADSGSPFLDLRILVALFVVGVAAWLMYYLLRPSND